MKGKGRGVMELTSSFKNLPSVHKWVYSAALVVIPILMIVAIILMSQVFEITISEPYILAIAFMIAPFIVIGKDVAMKKRIRLEEKGITYRSLFRKRELPFLNIKKVIALRVKDRLVMMFLPVNQKDIVALDDWFPMDEKEAFLKRIKEISRDHEFEVLETTEKNEALSSTRSIYNMK